MQVAARPRHAVVLAVLLAFLGTLALATTRADALVFGNPTLGSFEVDGNVPDSPVGEPTDWGGLATANPPLSGSAFTDRTDGSDDIFTGGSKQEMAAEWTCGVGKAPDKSDIASGEIRFRKLSDGKQYAYVRFLRVGTGGDAHVDFEFNKSTMRASPFCPAELKQRTVGDQLITFDTDTGGSNITVRAWEWNGMTFIERPLNGKVAGAVNIPDANRKVAGNFGEAVINLTDTIGEVTCGEFSSAWIKTRASTSITSALKDYTLPKGIDPGGCPSSKLTKGVRADGSTGAYGPTLTVGPGTTVQYQLTYTNSGTGTASGVVVKDTIQGGTLVAGSCSPACAVSGNELTWNLGDVPAGQSRTLTFKVTMPSLAGTVKNVGTADSGQEDPASSNETVVTVNAPADTKVDKSVDKETVSPDGVLTYTLKVTNVGGTTASNVVTTDKIPAGTTYVAGSCSIATECAVSNGTLTWTIPSLAPNESRTLTFQVKVDKTFSSTSPSIKNVACVKAGTEAEECDETTTTVTVSPSTAIGKGVRNVTAGATAFTPTANAAPGDEVEYQLSYTNTGSGPATSITLSDPIPPQSTFVSCSDTCTQTGTPVSSVSWTIAKVDPGQTATRTFRVKLTGPFTTPVTEVRNVATFKSGTTETKSPEVVVTVKTPADTKVDKSVDKDTVSPDGLLTYTLKVTNTGGTTATNVVTTDKIPAGTTYVADSCSIAAECKVENGTLTWTIASLAAGDSKTLTFQVKVDKTFSSTSPSIKNVACVKAGTEAEECDETTTTVDVAPARDVKKDVRNVSDSGAFDGDGRATADPGETVEYRISYTNTGTGPATGVVISDPIPAKTTFVSCSDSCTQTGTPVSSVSWTIPGQVNPGQTVTRTFQVKLDPSFPNGTTSVENVATVKDQSGTTDSPKAVVTVTAKADTSTSTKQVKLASAADSAYATTLSAKPGDVVTYRITVRNTGNAPAEDVVVNDVVPDKSTYVAGSCQVSQGTCELDGPPPTVGASLGTIPAGGTATLTFSTKLDGEFIAGETKVENVAVITAKDTPTTTTPKTVVTVTAKSDLEVVKAADRSTADGGDQITYTFQYTNAGDGTATAAKITDQVPAGTTYVSCSGGTSCSESNGVVTWQLGDVKAGGSGQVKLVVKAQPDACATTNTATISGGGSSSQSNTVTVVVEPTDDPSDAKASGSAVGLSTDSSALALNEKLEAVSSSQTGPGQSADSAELIDTAPLIDPAVVRAEVLPTSSSSRVSTDGSGARQVSTAEVARLSLLNGLITADAVRAVATAEATGRGSSVSRGGSTVVGLKVAGLLSVPVEPNSHIALPSLIFGAGSYIKVNTSEGTTSSANGRYSADQVTTGLQVHVTGLLGLIPLDITVAKAVAHADHKATKLCGPQARQSVGARALIASAAVTPLLPKSTVGLAEIPASGGADSSTVASPNIAGAVGSRTATTQATGTLKQSSTQANAFAHVEDACVLAVPGSTAPNPSDRCLIYAKAVRSESSSTATATSRSSSPSGTTFLTLTLRNPSTGQVSALPLTPAPNTTIPVPGVGFLVINEQTPDGPATGRTGLTVRALRLVVTLPLQGLATGAEVVVAEAHTDAAFIP